MKAIRYSCTIFIFSIISFQVIAFQYEFPIIEKVDFTTTDSIPLKATLYLPRDDVKKMVVILRDVTLDTPYPDFSLIADTVFFHPKIIQKLTQEQIGAIIIGRRAPLEKAESKLFRSQTLQTLADDAEHALYYLRSQKKFKDVRIGIWGTSETGCSAAVLAAKNREISFLLLLSTPSIDGLKQVDFSTKSPTSSFNNALFLSLASFMSSMMFDSAFFTYNKKEYEKKRGNLTFYELFWDSFCRINHEVIPNYEQYDTIKFHAKKMFMELWGDNKYTTTKKWRPNVELNISQCMDTIIHYWYTPRNVALIKWKPEIYYSKINCPVLLLFGMKDSYINVVECITETKKTVVKYRKNNFTLKTYSDLDHFLQKKDLEVTFIEKNGKRRTVKPVPDEVFNDVMTWFRHLP